jgi:hypothetical protein
MMKLINWIFALIMSVICVILFHVLTGAPYIVIIAMPFLPYIFGFVWFKLKPLFR